MVYYVNDGRRQFWWYKNFNEHAEPPPPLFFPSRFQEKCEEGSGTFRKKSWFRFFVATFRCESLNLQLKHIPRPAKACSFRTLVKRIRWPPIYFLILGIVIGQMLKKSSLFYMICIGSYLKLSLSCTSRRWGSGIAFSHALTHQNWGWRLKINMKVTWIDRNWFVTSFSVKKKIETSLVQYEERGGTGFDLPAFKRDGSGFDFPRSARYGNFLTGSWPISSHYFTTWLGRKRGSRPSFFLIS